MCAELCSLNCTRRALVLIVVVVVVAGKLRTGLVLIRTMQEDGLIDASEAQRLKADLIQERRDDASHLPKCALPPHRKGRTAKRPTSVYWPLRSWDLSFSSFKTAPESDFLANLSDAPSHGRKRAEPDDSTEEKDSEKDSQSLQVFAPLPFHTARAPSKAMDHQELVPLAFLLMSLLLRLPLLTLRAHGTI